MPSGSIPFERVENTFRQESTAVSQSSRTPCVSSISFYAFSRELSGARRCR